MPLTPPPCPQCGLENTYPDADHWVCPDCAHEWPQAAAQPTPDETGSAAVRDAHGQVLADGDSVILVKDLKVKGAAGGVLKKGSKVKGIRLVDGADGHNIDCKTDMGSLLLKSEFVKKA